MYSYFLGTVISINKTSITFEVNNKGYVINVANPNDFSQNQKIHLFVYAQYASTSKNSFIQQIYGFKTYAQKELFISLMMCQGIGPKTALGICRNDNSLIWQLINDKKYLELAKCKNINEKLAHTIIETLYDKSINHNKADPIITKLFSALNALGYKDTDIRYAINKINANNSKDVELSTLIANAIKIIVNHNNSLNDKN